MFASEYLMASFDDVCQLLGSVASGAGGEGSEGEGAHGEGSGREGSGSRQPAVRITGPLRLTSGTTASVAAQCAGSSSPPRWDPAEIRIISVQSGTAPLTELLLIAPPEVRAGDARSFVQALVDRLQSGVSRTAPTIGVGQSS